MAQIQFHSKEVSILRQSQQKMALEYLNTIGVRVSFEELQRITDVFVECCLRPQDESLQKRIKALDKWLEDKKSKQ